MPRIPICLVSPHAEAALRSRAGEVPARPFGGAEVQVALLATGLARRGHQVSLITHAAPAEDPSSTVVGGVHLIVLARPRGSNPASRLRHYYQLLVAGLEESGATLVYQRCGLPLTGMLAWICRKSGRRFTFAVANDRDVDGRNRHHLGWARNLIYQYGLRRSDRVIVQTEFQESLLRRQRPDVLRLPSLFDLNGIAPRPEPQQPAVLWVGNLLAKKRPLRLLEIAAKLPQIRFIVAGAPAGPASLLAAFRQRSDLLKNVELAGSVPHAAMDALYRRAAVLLNTSVAEGVPNAFLEAWAREVPVATLGVDPDGVIRRLDLGRVFPEASAGAELGSFIDDVTGRQRAGAAGRRHVADVHGMEVVLDGYEQLFSEI